MTHQNDRQNSVTMQTLKPLTLGHFNCSVDRRPACNSGFKKLAVQWLNQVQFFNQTFVQVDGEVLRNRQLLKPAKRWWQFKMKHFTN